MWRIPKTEKRTVPYSKLADSALEILNVLRSQRVVYVTDVKFDYLTVCKRAVDDGTTRLGAVAADCNQTVIPLRFIMSLLTILTMVTAILIMTLKLYNWFCKIDVA